MTGANDASAERAPKTPVSITLVRHGATEWSRAWRHTGRTDLPLLPEGANDAVRVGVRLAGATFGRVWVSPLQRARETCRIAGYGERAEVVDDLLEWDYGEAEGHTTAQLREERPGWSVWVDGPPGGEPLASVGERADRVISSALASPAGGDVLVFGHGHLLRVLAARWIGQPAIEGQRYRLDPATISVLGWEHDYRTINQWNARA